MIVYCQNLSLIWYSMEYQTKHKKGVIMDLRMSNQRVHGFYVYKNHNIYNVGVNGTAIHKSFRRNDFKSTKELKSSIMSFIYSNFIIKKG